MRPGKSFYANLLLAAWLLPLLSGTATASPLTAPVEATTPPPVPGWASPGVQPPQADPHSDTPPGESFVTPPLSVRDTVREAASTAASPASPWDAYGTAGFLPAGRSVSEQLRDFVQVEPARGTAPKEARGARARPGPTVPGFAGIDLGAAADEWIRDTVQSLMNATLRLDVDEHGRVSFSVLGLGEFSVTVSGDRSQFALAEGGEVLLVTQRSPGPGAGGRDSDAASPFGYSSGAPLATLEDEPQIWQALSLVMDIASHPVSLLVYCVIAAYLLLWSLLTRQPQRVQVPVVPADHAPLTDLQRPLALPKPRRRTSSRAKLGRESAPSARTTKAPSEPAASASTPVKRRKRIRVRIRTRTWRPHSSRHA